MSKSHRGKALREQANHARGTCPRCGKTSVKLLYEQEIGGEKKNICKYCKGAIANGKAV
jgi:hypothetical protein